MPSWRACLLASVLALPLAPFAQDSRAHGGETAPRPADARALLAAFARMPGLEARFTEEKELALLAVPLRSSGRLYFLPPAHLTREVEEPEPSRLAITPAELRMRDRDGEQVLDLRANEPVRAFVTSLLWVFAGDLEKLEGAFTVVYTPEPADAAAWSLALTPRAKPLSDLLGALTLSGAGTAVRRIELREPNGDRTRTTIVAADAERRFSAEERQRLFGLPPEPEGEPRPERR